MFAPRPYLEGLRERRALNSNLPAITVFGDESSSAPRRLPLSLYLCHPFSLRLCLHFFSLALFSFPLLFLLTFFLHRLKHFVALFFFSPSSVCPPRAPPPPPLAHCHDGNECTDFITDAMCHASQL